MMTVPNFYRLETSRWDMRPYNPFLMAPLDNSNGSLKLPRLPGLGIEMNRSFLEANQIDLA